MDCEAGSAKPYFYGIDLVRFAAALMVTLFHLGYSSNTSGSRGFALSHGAQESSISPFIQWGDVGVEIFFVISGYVIANSANGASAFRFLRSRAERLYPAVWICATVSFLVWLTDPSTSWANDLLLYVRTLPLFPFGPDWIDAPYWTLGHEVIFYGCVWLLLAAGQFRRIEWLAMAITFIAAIYWGGTALDQLGVVQIPGIGELGKGVPRMLFPVFGAYFAVGIFLWLRFNAHLSKVGSAVAVIALLAAIAPFLLSWRREGGFPQELVAWSLGLGAIVAASFFPGRLENERVVGRVVRVLGLATYPLYLIHFALGIVSIRLLVHLGIPVDFALAVVVMGLVALASLIAIQGEPPIRRSIRKAFKSIERQSFLEFLARANSPVPEKPQP